MSQPPASSPPPYYPPPGPTGPAHSGEPPKTIAILALIFGATALLFGLIPAAGVFFGGLFGFTAIVLGIIGILKSRKAMSTIARCRPLKIPRPVSSRLRSPRPALGRRAHDRIRGAHDQRGIE